jgi:hypothetical protein
MNKLSPEVLIYVQSVKNYFQKNDEAREYFISNSDEEQFFKHLSEISQKNFDKNGEVMLDKTQFELLRVTVQAIAVVTTPVENLPSAENYIFIDMRGYAKICLN